MVKAKAYLPYVPALVQVGTPEARQLEMTREEILAVPDSDILRIVRNRVAEIRRVRLINLNETTPVADVARKVHAVAARFFGWQ